MENTNKSPLMYGIVDSDGVAYIGENCVASSPQELFLELNGLNDSPDAGYKIVALGQFYLDAAAPQLVADDRTLQAAIQRVRTHEQQIGASVNGDASIGLYYAVNALGLAVDALERAAPVQAQPVAVVYPPDGTVSPFTVINLGRGLVKIGDSLHDGRLPALWFGADGLGMGVSEEMNRAAKEGETLAVVTFSNVEGLDVLSEVVQRIRSVSFPGSPARPVAVPDDRDPRERFKEAYTWLINTHFASPIWNQTMEQMLCALDEELSKRATPAAQGDALNAKRYEFLRAVGPEQQNIIAHYAMEEMDKAVDAAIAAKAAS